MLAGAVSLSLHGALCKHYRTPIVVGPPLFNLTLRYALARALHLADWETQNSWSRGEPLR